MNPAARTDQMIDHALREDRFRAIVDVVSANEASFVRIGQSTPDPRTWPMSHTLVGALSQGDEVVVQRVGNGYFIAHKLVRN